MDTTANVAGLVDLGLTRYEARAYLALIGRSDATPAEIARMASIPRQRAYDVLASLGERGLVQLVPGQAVRYRAQPPDHVIELLVAVRRRELDRLAQSSTGMAEQLQSLFQRGQDVGNPFDYVEVLRDREHAVERVQQLWTDARHEVLTFVHPPYLGASTPSNAEVPPGIVQRSIYEMSILDDPAMTERVRTWAHLGEQIRLTTELPLKMTVVDGRSVAFNMPDSAEGDGSVTTLVVQHAALAATLKIAFESLWAQGSSLENVMAARSY